MTTEGGEPTIAEAAARWVATAGTSARVRDARRWDLGVVARILGDTLNRPPAAPEPKVHLRQLRAPPLGRP